jgi:prophage endopeptidase
MFGFSPLPILAAVAMALAGFGVGWHERAIRADLAETRLAQEALVALNAANLKAKHDTEALNETVAVLDGKAQLERENAKKANDLYHAALRAGAVRVSVPVAAGSCRATGDSTAAGQPAQARAELDPAAAGDLDSIAADGDQAIRDLNEVIDLYNAAREALNKKD